MKIKPLERIKQKIKCRKGEMYIDTAISVFVMLIVLAIVMSVVPVLIKQYQLNVLANDVTRYIEVAGSSDNLDADKIYDENMIKPSNLQVDGGGEKIQLGKTFSVTLEYETEIGLGGLIEIPITITSKAQGTSEVYWK